MGRGKSKRSRRSFWSSDFDLDDLLDWDDFFEDLSSDRRSRWQVQRRVMLSASRKSDTSFPIGLGILGLLAAVMLGGGPLLFLLAIAAITIGVWRFAGRVFSGIGHVAQRSLQRAFETQKGRQDRLLEELDRKLQTDEDPRLRVLLLRLSRLHDSLESDIKGGKLSVSAAEVLQSVERVFQMCIEHLETAHRLGEEARSRGFDALPELQQREELIREVEESADHLERTVGQLQERTLDRKKSELQRMREELDETVRIARRVEERTDDLIRPNRTHEVPE